MSAYTVARALRVACIPAGVTAILCVAACGSYPDETEIEIGPGGGTVKINRDGDSGPLPEGWTPGSEHHDCFPVKGHTYCVDLCIATNGNEPNCIYVNLGSCDPDDGGWVRYCEELATQSLGMRAIQYPPTSYGTVSYDAGTSAVDVEFTLASSVHIDTDLVDVYIAHPSDPTTFLPSDDFILLYGPTAPVGAIVQFTGDAGTTAWNAYLLNVERCTLATTGGDSVASVILVVTEGAHRVPIAATVLNGSIVDTRVVHAP